MRGIILNKKFKKVLGWILLALLGYAINEILDFLREKPNIDFIMPTTMENDYLPIIVDNIGQKPLKLIEIKLNSCYMQNERKTFFIEELQPNQKHTIMFKEENTINKFNKINCTDLTSINYSKEDFYIKIYRNKNTGKLIIPSQTHAYNVCGYCYWDINVTSDKLNMTLREYTYSPIQVIQKIGDEGQTPYSENDLVYFETIAMNIFDDRVLKAFQS